MTAWKANRNSLLKTCERLSFSSSFFNLLHAAGETAVHITIVNGDLQSFKLLVGQCGADVHARARGRFFMPEDCKDKIKQETNYDGKWSKAAHSSFLVLLLCCFLGFVDWSSKNFCLGSSSVFVSSCLRVIEYQLKRGMPCLEKQWVLVLLNVTNWAVFNWVLKVVRQLLSFWFWFY